LVSGLTIVIVFIGEVFDHTLCKNIERSAKSYVIGWQMNYIDFKIEGDIAYAA
jgi:hypothetical protein